MMTFLTSVLASGAKATWKSGSDSKDFGKDDQEAV
jgi:hypothetical protein